MLFEAVDASLLAAQGALERGDIPAKCAAISKAARIVDEGLRAALDPKGGELTDNLDALYDYCVRRLTEANLRNDAGMVQEVRGLLAPVAQAWNQIRPQ
jgi:flagellar protein FliS